MCTTGGHRVISARERRRHDALPCLEERSGKRLEEPSEKRLEEPSGKRLEERSGKRLKERTVYRSPSENDARVEAAGPGKRSIIF